MVKWLLALELTSVKITFLWFFLFLHFFLRIFLHRLPRSCYNLTDCC